MKSITELINESRLMTTETKYEPMPIEIRPGHAILCIQYEIATGRIVYSDQPATDSESNARIKAAINALAGGKGRVLRDALAAVEGAMSTPPAEPS